MKSVIALAAGVLLSTATCFAQTDADTPTSGKKKINAETFQPDVKGDLLFAVGLNVFTDVPNVAKLSNWGSKSVNLYYLYDFDLGNTGFSFHPGFGLAFEKYAWENRVNLQEDLSTPGVDGAPRIVFQEVETILNYPDGQNVDLRKSKLAATYLDIPLEFSYAFKKNNPRAGLKIVAGGRVGLLLGNHTKIKYRTISDDTRKFKLRQDYNLNPFRYTAHTRIGYGGFSLYFEYQLSEVFDAGDAPFYNAGTDATPNVQQLPEVNNWRIGLAIDLF